MATDETQNLRAQLETVPLFKRCATGDLRVVAEKSHLRDAPAGEHLVRQGEAGQEFFLLLDGKAEVRRAGDVVATLGPGGHFGELALLSPAPRDADVVMTDAGRVAVVDRGSFLLLLEGIPGLGREMLSYLAARVRDAETGDQTERI